jgi:hypothetical protein
VDASALAGQGAEGIDPVRVALSAGAAALSLGAWLLASAPGYTQSPPPLPAPGFMPPYEITKIARSAGFDPLAPPLREGTTYVLRATDFRGVLMRVVVDAHSGAIRAVNRIVPPGPYGPNGPIGMTQPPYGTLPPAYGPPEIAYRPPDVEGPQMMPEEASLPPLPPPLAAVHPAPHSFNSQPPLPRPRPAELAADKPAEDLKPVVAPAAPAAPATPAVARPVAPVKKPPPVQLPD